MTQTTATATDYAAQRAAKKIAIRINGGDYTGIDDLIDIIAAEFGSLVAKAEAADRLAEALGIDADVIHDHNLSGSHSEHFGNCTVPRCVNRRKLIAAYRALEQVAG